MRFAHYEAALHQKMKKMETTERLKRVVDTGKTTAEDKQLIVELSEKYNLPFDPKKGCKNCYIDQAILILLEMRSETPYEPGKARLRDDIDVVINGTRINNATLTDEIVEKYRGKGLPEHWFV